MGKEEDEEDEEEIIWNLERVRRFPTKRDQLEVCKRWGI